MSKGQVPHALMEELRSWGYDAEADGTIRYQPDAIDSDDDQDNTDVVVYTGSNTNEEDNTMLNVDVRPSKGDQVVDVAAKVTAKTIVVAGKSAVIAGKGTKIAVKAGHKWVKDTGAPTAIKAGRGIGSKLKRYLTTTYNEVQTSRQVIKNNNNNKEIT